MGIGYFGEIDSSMQISNHFTLGDLTVTNQAADNTPSLSEIENLKKLGIVLDNLYDTIGPFKVISAFRSAAVQQALTDAGEPTAEGSAGKISFHTVGLAADIDVAPMSVDDYFGYMVAAIGTSESPGPLHDQMSEVAFKPSQHSIHLAAAVDYRPNNVILALNSVGKYAKLTADEIMAAAGPYLAKAEELASEAVAAVATPVGMGAMAALVIGGLVLYFMTKKPSRAIA